MAKVILFQGKAEDVLKKLGLKLSKSEKKNLKAKFNYNIIPADQYEPQSLIFDFVVYRKETKEEKLKRKAAKMGYNLTTIK